VLTSRKDKLPILLELDLSQPLIEVEPDDPIAKLRTRGKPRLRPLLRALYEAGNDDRVVGVVARIGSAGVSLAQAQEIRAAVAAFRATNKPAVAWAETFGEAGPGSIPYFLATGFSEIWLQPSGDVNLLGLSAEVQFMRGLLDKLGVEPQMNQRYEYKNAADRLTRTEMTDAHREAIGRLTESSWEQVVDGIAAGRSLTAAEVRAAADRAPLLAHDALDARLVDKLGYRDEVYSSVRRDVGADVRLLFADKWTRHEQPIGRVVRQVKQKKAPGVAVVDGYGGVAMGRSRRSPMGQMMGSDTVSAALRAAVKDERVKAIVFRVDSPGGSYVASDTIWREVVCARAAGKPVVVSMGAVAGSGGYFVACPADVIVAQPGTITGSIGVFGGKAVTAGLTDKLGVTYGAVQQGRNALMYSTHRRFDDAELERLDAFLDHVYDDFTAKVAEGRKMTQDDVHAIAKGRVWTGADAADNGLVDTLGGLRDAVRIARERAGLPADAPARPAVTIPPLARLKPPRSTDDPRAAAASVSLWSSGWGEFAGIAERLGLSAYGPLTMTGITVR
jgi:protease IV